jgi:putative MATE family efflux protein
MVNDMTKGRPMKLILTFCIPMLMGNIIQQLYNMVDSIVVGRFVGVDAFAGVSSTGSLTFLVIGFVMGLTSGFSIKVAQSFGAGDYKEMRKYIANALYLSGAFAVVLTALTVLFTRPLLRVMQTPENIIDYAYDYIIILFAGISVTIMYNILASILRAVGDSKTPLIFLGVAAMVNIVLDLLFVISFNMGVKGVGYATIIAQIVSAVLGIIYIKKRYYILHIQMDELRMDLEKCKELAYIGVPMALQYSITAVGTIILQFAVNSLGSATVAAVGAATKVQSFAILPMETWGLAVATYAGQNFGAREYNRIRDGVNKSLVLGVVYSVFIYVIIAVFGGYISLLFIKKEEIAILGDVVRFLRISGAFYPTLAVLFVVRNVLQGLGYSMITILAGVSELIARAVIAIVFVRIFGYDAVILAGPVAWICADMIVIITYIVKQNDLRRICIEQSDVVKVCDTI